MHAILLISLSGTATTTPTLLNKTDRLALLAFKTEIRDDPLQALISWNNSLHFCEWRGVTCGHRHQRVRALNLGSLSLEGPLSPHIAISPSSQPSTSPRTDSMAESLTNLANCFGFSNLTYPLTHSKKKSRQL
ncbi:putative LRR receptor-like serine/threonine-protein kinase [Cinnamomum micranthum f. kanehirae]|uniref:Putative LRR receptor-like serine/threonine-protein kinase n=1 Tax=Cinnamomum micranthum f. kanehirae TaxID=337451 RepID=A0A3S3M813_9MAGN|nr:putative LRR receptor-like serine/threonine-protein kinase [Cinnamomum micranthum f. kanehirae]